MGGPVIRLHSQLAGRSREARGGNWTVRREKSREEEWKREEGEIEGRGDGEGDPILQNGARHNLFIWCPSGSTFSLQHCSADLPPCASPSPTSSLFTLSSSVSPSCLPSLVVAFASYWCYCAHFCHPHTAAISSIILIKCTNWLFKEKLPRRGKELRRPRPVPALHLHRMRRMVMLMLNKQRGF